MFPTELQSLYQLLPQAQGPRIKQVNEQAAQATISFMLRSLTQPSKYGPQNLQLCSSV